MVLFDGSVQLEIPDVDQPQSTGLYKTILFQSHWAKEESIFPVSSDDGGLMNASWLKTIIWPTSGVR